MYAPACGCCTMCFPMLCSEAEAVPVREQQGGAWRVLHTPVSPCNVTTCTELAGITRNQPRRQGHSGTSVRVLAGQHKVDHLGLGPSPCCGGTAWQGRGVTARLFLWQRPNSIRSWASGWSSSSEPLPGSSGE